MRLRRLLSPFALAFALLPGAAAAGEPPPASPGLALAQPAVSTPAPAPEAAPSASPSPSASRVVLVDDLPYRGVLRTRADAEGKRKHGKKHGRHGRPYHPAPGIVVDVTDARGGAAATDLQRKARNDGYWPLRRCYEEGLRRDQHEGGKVSFDLSIAASGSVDRVTGVSSTFGDESVALCAAREAAALAFDRAEQTTTAHVDITLQAGDEPVPMPKTVAHAEELRQALRSQWTAVKQCYEGDLAKHPSAGGRMELRMRVERSGEVADASEGDSRFGDIDVTRCVLGVYRTAKLPPLAHAPREVSFTYALHFESVSGSAPFGRADHESVSGAAPFGRADHESKPEPAR